MPEQYIDKELRGSYLSKIESVEDRINSFRQAIEGEGLVFNLDTISKFRTNEKAIFDMMEKAYNDYAKTLKFVPPVELERIKSSYMDIADSLDNANRAIFNMLEQYKYSLMMSKDRIVFDKKEVDAYVNTIGIRTFSDKEREYVKLLNTATKAIIDVANFEAANGLEEYALSCFVINQTGNNRINPFAYGLANDSRTGVVNTERIIRGVKRR